MQLICDQVVSSSDDIIHILAEDPHTSPNTKENLICNLEEEENNYTKDKNKAAVTNTGEKSHHDESTEIIIVTPIRTAILVSIPKTFNISNILFNINMLKFNINISLYKSLKPDEEL